MNQCYKKLFMVVVFATIVSGCVAPRVSDKALKNISSVGVYSNFSDEMHYITGTTIFTAEENIIKVPEWGIIEYS